MKNMSFKTLMAIFGGFIAVIIIIAVVIMGSSSPKQMVKKRQEPEPQQINNLMADQLRQQKDALATIQAQVNQQNQMLLQRLNMLASNINELNQRVTTIETTQNKSNEKVKIVKPSRRPRVSTMTQIEKKATPLPPSSGYKVMALIGKRAWISAGDREESVTEGDILPPVEKPFVVRALNSESGNVIISHPNDE